MNIHWMAFYSLCLLCLLAKRTYPTPTCNSQDFIALNGFLDLLEDGIHGWESHFNADCCTWDGVLCEFVSPTKEHANMSSRVVSLELSHKKLRGKLSESLAGLDQLRVLNLSGNFLRNDLPMELFRYEHLTVLDLSSNQFTGNITMEFSLPSLRFLDLSHNILDGSLNGDICAFAKSLQLLDLSMNYFTGKVPATIGNCSSLEVLSLGTNFLAGNLPEDLFRLPNLRVLNLQNNRFSGLLSPATGNLSNIMVLDISFNEFSGEIPDAFSNLQKLEQFSANLNRFTGALPPSLSSSPSISSLELRNNSLDGSIVFSSAMVSLTSLDLSFNLFNSPTPDNLSSHQQLNTLDLSQNNISNSLSESFKNLTSLTHLSLTNCSLQNLSAALTILQNCKNLTTLLLSYNFRKEEMPAALHLQFDKLEILVIANSQLTGSVPTWLNGCSMLQVLDLSGNQLSGTVPDFLSELEFLFFLDLSLNFLKGEIPKGLTKLKRLTNNNTALKEPRQDLSLFYGGNENARMLQDNQIWFFPTLDLSYNFFTGPILAEFGNLKQLFVLNLRNNNLSGHIPDTLSQLTYLEVLDLSHNYLDGPIPDTLMNLHFLAQFTVAFNQLSGRIPTGGQFDTFPESSFEGNSHLCSLVLLKSCLLMPEESPEGEDSIIGLPFAFAAPAGFIIAVSICYLTGWLLPKEKAKRRIEIAR